MSMDETAVDQETQPNPDGADTGPVRAKRAIRGFGYAYQRGRVWWVRYSHRGRDHRESTGSERETDAWRLLKARWKQIGRGRFVFGEDRATMADLGVSQSVAMALSGHKTASVYRRYRIVAEDDLREALVLSLISRKCGILDSRREGGRKPVASAA